MQFYRWYYGQSKSHPRISSIEAKTYHLNPRTEMWLIIIMGTMPTLRPLFVKFFHTVSSFKNSRNTRSGIINTGGSNQKELYSGSMQLRSVPGSKVNGNNRTSQHVIGSSESEEDILPKGDGIMVKNDFNVAFAERTDFANEGHQHTLSQVTGPHAV